MAIKLLLGSMLLTVACGEKQFNKGNPKSSDAIAEAQAEQTPGGMPSSVIPTEEGSVDPAVANEAEMPPVPENPPMNVALPAEQRNVLDQCLKQWITPPPPFSAEEKSNPTVINITEDKKNNQYIYTHELQTSVPKLYLVNLSVDIANQGTMALKNAKGWYCLNVTAKVINNFTILLTQDNQLAIVSKFAQNDNKFFLVRE